MEPPTTACATSDGGAVGAPLQGTASTPVACNASAASLALHEHGSLSPKGTGPPPGKNDTELFGHDKPTRSKGGKKSSRSRSENSVDPAAIKLSTENADANKNAYALRFAAAAEAKEQPRTESTPSGEKATESPEAPTSRAPAPPAPERKTERYVPPASGRRVLGATRAKPAGGVAKPPTPSVLPETEANDGAKSHQQVESKATGAADLAASKRGSNQRGSTSKAKVKGGDSTVPEPKQEGQPTDTPAPTAATAENVWNKAKEVLLRQRVAALPTPGLPADEIEYATHYECARGQKYRIMADGYQRALTELEEETLFLWRAKMIHLPAPPCFITETHTLKERLALLQIHADHMGFKLYVATPARLKWPAATAKYHFCASLVGKNQTDGCTDGQVLALLKDVHLFTCSADSHLAILRFVRPDVRDQWTNKQFLFPFGKIKLRATDTFEQEDKKAGLDAAAVDMLYPIHLLGHPTMPLTDVHELAQQLSGGLPILDIVPIEPTGARTLDDHVWSIRLNSMETPPGLDQVRCLDVTQGERVLKVGVHLPRAATRPPCSVCLGVDHFRNKCPNKETASELRVPFVKAVTLAATASYAVEPAAATLEEHRAQMARMRHALAPELTPPATEAKPSAEPVPVPAPSPAAPAGSSTQEQKATASARQMNAAQVQTITRAIGKSKASAGGKTRTRKKRGTAKPRLVGGKVPQPVEPWAEGTWPLTGARPGHKHARDDGHSAGRAFRAAAVELEGALTGLAPGRQAKASETHGSIDRSLPEPPKENEAWAPPGGVRDENHRPRLGQMTLTPFCRTLDPHAEDAAQQAGLPASPDFTLIGVLPAPTTLELSTLLSDIGARQVATPANGSCLFHAFVAAQSRECGQHVDGSDKIEIKLADDLRTILYELLRDKLVEFLYTASLSLQDLREDHLDPKNPLSVTKAVPLLKAYFDEASRLSSAAVVPRKYWGGDAALAAFVLSTTEPVYILSVDPDGATAILRYALMPVYQSDGSKLLRVVRQAPTPEMFRAQLDVYKRHKVVPVLLVLNHSVVDGTHSSHYTAARLGDAFYKECVGTLRVRGAMLQRLPRVIAEIDDMNTHGSLPAPRPAPMPGSPDTSSVYEPSSVTSADSSGTAAGTTEPAVGSAEPAKGADGDVTKSGSKETDPPVAIVAVPDGAGPAASASAEDDELEIILSSQPEPGMSQDSLLRWMPISPATPQTPLEHAEERALLIQLQQAPPYADHVLIQLKKATSPNKTALGGFMRRLATDQPALLALIRHAKNPAAACLALQDHPSGLRELVRSMPYPEVLVALLDDSILIRAGRVAIYLGRLQMLHRLQAQLPKTAASFCRDWARRIHDSPLPDGKWLVAQEAHSWRKLHTHAEKYGVSVPERAPGGLPDAAWCRLVAYLLLVPSYVPNPFAGRSFPVQSDALLAWASRSANSAVFAATALTVAQRQWLSASDVMDHWKKEWEPSQADDDMGIGSVVAAASRH